MNTLKMHIATVFACGAVVLATGSPIAALAGVQMAVAAIKVNKGDKFELVLDDKNAGRMVYFFSFHAINKAIKGGDLVDGVKNTGGGYADITQGRGHVSGFDVNEEDGDIWKAGWAGECYPVTGLDGTPVTHCAGGWSVVPASGTGRFAGLSGGGEFHGHALANGDFEVEWSGTLEK
jgi:hypothetical protein